MMRALTLTQPWAGLVASGIKLVENRPRKMIKREDFGKPFAIHASREFSEDDFERIVTIAPDLRQPDPQWFRLAQHRSSVIAVATLDSMLDPLAHGILPDTDDARAALPLDQRRWFFGPVGYVLRDVIALPVPVPCRGWQGFWTLPADVEAKVRAQITPIADLIDRSSIGSGLRNIRENGIEAELADLEEETRR